MKLCLSLFLFLAVSLPCFATCAIGDDMGFCAAAPTSDPAGSTSNFDSKCNAVKDTTSSDFNQVTEMGWWCNNATEAADFQVGIYSHDAVNDEPDALLQTSGDIAKGTTSGWKTSGSLTWSLSASTTYWVAAQLDNTATTTQIDKGSGARIADAGTQSSLPDPFGSIVEYDNSGRCIYAEYDTGVAEEFIPRIFITKNERYNLAYSINVFGSIFIGDL